jgi:dienelactone hydrolase
MTNISLEERIEYPIDSGHIAIIGEGRRYPAYWAHPRIGGKFSGIALLHDWWGMANWVRMMANFFAMRGYYVIAPDLFHEQTASTPKEAMALIEKTKDTRYEGLDATLTVLETHNRTNRKVAAVGVGMGGTLAYEAALKRTDLEAAVSYAGFPQAYMGQFKTCNTPILAFYGEKEPYTKPIVIETMRQELLQSPVKDRSHVEIVPNVGHDIFHDQMSIDELDVARQLYLKTQNFLKNFLIPPTEPHKKTVI